MKTETKEIYKCEYCNKLYQLKRFALLHEQYCHKNPENFRKCLNCSHLVKKEVIIYSDTPVGEMERGVQLFFCSKIYSFLYPPKVEIKKNHFELGDYSNKPMRKKCVYFSDSSENANLI